MSGWLSKDWFRFVFARDHESSPDDGLTGSPPSDVEGEELGLDKVASNPPSPVIKMDPVISMDPTSHTDGHHQTSPPSSPTSVAARIRSATPAQPTAGNSGGLPPAFVKAEGVPGPMTPVTPPHLKDRTPPAKTEPPTPTLSMWDIVPTEEELDLSAAEVEMTAGATEPVWTATLEVTSPRFGTDGSFLDLLYGSGLSDLPLSIPELDPPDLSPSTNESENSLAVVPVAKSNGEGAVVAFAAEFDLWASLFQAPSPPDITTDNIHGDAAQTDGFANFLASLGVVSAPLPPGADAGLNLADAAFGTEADCTVDAVPTEGFSNALLLALALAESDPDALASLLIANAMNATQTATPQEIFPTANNEGGGLDEEAFPPVPTLTPWRGVPRATTPDEPASTSTKKKARKGTGACQRRREAAAARSQTPTTWWRRGQRQEAGRGSQKRQKPQQPLKVTADVALPLVRLDARTEVAIMPPVSLTPVVVPPPPNDPPPNAPLAIPPPPKAAVVEPAAAEPAACLPLVPYSPSSTSPRGRPARVDPLASDLTAEVRHAYGDVQNLSRLRPRRNKSMKLVFPNIDEEDDVDAAADDKSRSATATAAMALDDDSESDGLFIDLDDDDDGLLPASERERAELDGTAPPGVDGEAGDGVDAAGDSTPAAPMSPERPPSNMIDLTVAPFLGQVKAEPLELPTTEEAAMAFYFELGISEPVSEHEPVAALPPADEPPQSGTPPSSMFPDAYSPPATHVTPETITPTRRTTPTLSELHCDDPLGFAAVTETPPLLLSPRLRPAAPLGFMQRSQCPLDEWMSMQPAFFSGTPAEDGVQRSGGKRWSTGGKNRLAVPGGMSDSDDDSSSDSDSSVGNRGAGLGKRKLAPVFGMAYETSDAEEEDEEEDEEEEEDGAVDGVVGVGNGGAGKGLGVLSCFVSAGKGKQGAVAVPPSAKRARTESGPIAQGAGKGSAESLKERLLGAARPPPGKTASPSRPPPRKANASPTPIPRHKRRVTWGPTSCYSLPPSRDSSSEDDGFYIEISAETDEERVEPLLSDGPGSVQAPVVEAMADANGAPDVVAGSSDREMYVVPAATADIHTSTVEHRGVPRVEAESVRANVMEPMDVETDEEVQNAERPSSAANRANTYSDGWRRPPPQTGSDHRRCATTIVELILCTRGERSANCDRDHYDRADGDEAHHGRTRFTATGKDRDRATCFCAGGRVASRGDRIARGIPDFIGDGARGSHSRSRPTWAAPPRRFERCGDHAEDISRQQQLRAGTDRHVGSYGTRNAHRVIALCSDRGSDHQPPTTAAQPCDGYPPT
ncbi:hypothetical protein HDU96_008714 [Phlyctochytrium bullatum]|nr:hypothetical protein HDU96_008714 [Phlyctochytrium bullatum]